MEIQTYDQFSESRGVSSCPPSFPEMHRHPRRPSKQSQKDASRRILMAMAEWQSKRDALRLEFESLRVDGQVREPTRMERLTKTAQGDGDAAQAARRILERMNHETESGS